MTDKVSKPDTDWKRQLSPQQFLVTRQKGTEPPFTGSLLHNKDQGTYQCVCCGHTLFASDTKFDSGSGWPSFFDVIDRAHVRLEEDRSHGMVRTEVMCGRCDAHLGHVFPDGPNPTGLRYCINSASLDFCKTDP